MSHHWDLCDLCHKSWCQCPSTPMEAWEYLKKYLKEDGWGQDGPYLTSRFIRAQEIVERVTRNATKKKGE